MILKVATTTPKERNNLYLVVVVVVINLCNILVDICLLNAKSICCAIKLENKV